VRFSSLVLPNAVLEIAIPLCHCPGKGSMDLIAVYCGPAETRRIMAVYIPLYTLFLSLTLSKPCNQALFHAFAEGVPCLLTCRQCRRLKWTTDHNVFHDLSSAQSLGGSWPVDGCTNSS
jgi:hypothetical protein